MTDVVVTVPKGGWKAWLAEGDLPGEDAQFVSHFWVSNMPNIGAGERVYVVSHGRIRGYAPLFDKERICSLNRLKMCLMRRGGAEALTTPEVVRGFQGWRYRWWARDSEVPFPDWQTEGVE